MGVDLELIDRFLDGEASQAETDKLKAWLEVPANLEQFVQRAEMHADLRSSLLRRNIQAGALDACQEERIQASPGTAASRYRSVYSSRRMLAVCAMLATAASAMFVLLPPGKSQRSAVAENHAARIVNNVNALLLEGDQSYGALDLRPASYRLQRGLLHLQFEGGVMVYLEAPAQFEAISGERVVLHSGRLSANVPPAGIGFTVETPEAEVIDFGTEFSVEVESGASEVHVFDGLVRVQPRSQGDGQKRQAVDLKTSQAVKIEDATTAPVDIQIARDRFIRNFDEPKRKYSRSIKTLSPVAYYRMPIRDRGLIAEPPSHSGIVMTGEGIRPPHARGVFNGGSLRVGAESSGRGGRVDTPPELSTGHFALSVFVYLETRKRNATVATNIDGPKGNFRLSVNSDGLVEATIRDSNGVDNSVACDSPLPLKTWHHFVLTVDGKELRLYENGSFVNAKLCGEMAVSQSVPIWMGTDSSSDRLWDGRIDELAFFDRALSEESIVRLYEDAREESSRSK